MFLPNELTRSMWGGRWPPWEERDTPPPRSMGKLPAPIPIVVVVTIPVVAVIPVAAVVIVVTVVIAIAAVAETENFRDSHIVFSLSSEDSHFRREIPDARPCHASLMDRPWRGPSPNRGRGYAEMAIGRR